MSRLTVFAVPYDSGRRDFRMGRGPRRLLAAGLLERLTGQGYGVDLQTVGVDMPVADEPRTSFALLGQLAHAVRQSTSGGSRPIVLAGNCMTSVATVAGIAEPEVGVVWLDAHGDLNTPRTSPSGFLDGMALAMLLGQCWLEELVAIEGAVALPAERVILVGASDLDPSERIVIERCGLTHLRAGYVASRLGPALDALSRRAACVHLHIDLDVLDPSVARFNEYHRTAGMSVEAVERLIAEIGCRSRLASAALTAFDPEFDEDGRAVEAALRLIDAVARMLCGR